MITLSQKDIDRLKKGGAKSRPVKKAKKPPEKKVEEPKVAQPDLSGALALHEKTAKMAQDISVSSAEVVANLAGAMEKMISADNERKPHPYRFIIERDNQGIMKSVTATPMGQKG